MNLVFEKLTQTLAASGVWRLGIVADYFRIAAATYPVTVRLYRDGRVLGEMANFQAGDYVAGVEFDAVHIENGGNAQSVTAQLAGGGVGSDRVLGEVSVIDGSKARTLANTAFLTDIGIGPVAAEYSHVELWNPAASGKRAIVKTVLVRGAAGLAILRFHNAALGTAGANIGSKLSGGAIPTCLAKSTTAASIIGSEPIFFAAALVAGTSLVYKFDEPIVIEPGYGLLGYHSDVNVGFGVNYEFIEEATS